MRAPLGCFNLHASLLPRWRGAAPIHRAIMAGDAESGVMVMKMDVGLDTGDIAMVERAWPCASVSPRHDGAAICMMQLARAGRGVDGATRMTALEDGTLDAPQAAGRRRHLRRQDRQGRGAHRLVEARACRAASHPRAVAVSRRVVRDCRCEGEHRAHQGSARASSRSGRAPGTLLDDQS